jgi:hypothetical protein
MQEGPAHLFILARRSKANKTRGHGCEPRTGIGSDQKRDHRPGNLPNATGQWKAARSDADFYYLQHLVP